MSVQALTDSFRAAKVGQVFKQKASKGVRYSLCKTSAQEFQVEAIAAGKDTMVTVADTLTRVHTNQFTTITLEKQLTVFEKACIGIKNSIIWLLLLLVVTCGGYTS